MQQFNESGMEVLNKPWVDLVVGETFYYIVCGYSEGIVIEFGQYTKITNELLKTFLKILKKLLTEDESLDIL